MKEMLAASLQEGATSQHVQLAAAARGLVTYATPHFGTWLADVGWNLRYIGASPAAAVLHLKPGQHLEVRSAGGPGMLRLCAKSSIAMGPIGREDARNQTDE